MALTKWWDPADESVSGLAGITPRKKSDAQGFFKIVKDAVDTSLQALSGGAIYYDIAGSGTTDGSGDLAIDLSSTFASVAWAILIPRGTTFENLQLQSISTATVTYRSFDATGAARTTAATSYVLLVGGTPAAA